MNRVIRSLFRRENVPVVLLVIGAFLGVIGVPQKIGIAADRILLALLAVLALDTLIERLGYLDRIENLLKENRVLLGQTEELVRRGIGEKVRPSDFLLTDRAVTEEFFTSARRIILTGITLQSRIKQLTHVLEQRLSVGATIQLALLEPSESNLDQIVARGWGGASPEYYRSIIEASVARLDIIARNAQGKGQMEIGYLPFHPAMAFEMVDPDQSHGACWVTILPHKSTRPSPSFRLQASEDPERYRYFLEQFDLLWKSCRIERLPWPTDQQRLVVNSATYGVKGETVDVVEIVRSKISQGRLELLVCNEVLVDEDPVPGKRKYLTVDYTYAGWRDSVVITEGGTLLLPKMEKAA